MYDRLLDLGSTVSRLSLPIHGGFLEKAAAVVGETGGKGGGRALLWSKQYELRSTDGKAQDQPGESTGKAWGIMGLVTASCMETRGSKGHK